MPYFGDETNFRGVEGIRFGDLDLQHVGAALVRRVRRTGDFSAQFRKRLIDQFHFDVTAGHLIIHGEGAQMMRGIFLNYQNNTVRESVPISICWVIEIILEQTPHALVRTLQ